MAPKNRQSVKKKSPPSWPRCFISVTQPYINNLLEDFNYLTKWIVDTLKFIEVVRAVFFSVLFQTTIILPNNKTGNHCPHKGISQDGSHVPEKMSLKNKSKHAANFTEVTVFNHKLKQFI